MRHADGLPQLTRQMRTRSWSRRKTLCMNRFPTRELIAASSVFDGSIALGGEAMPFLADRVVFGGRPMSKSEQLQEGRVGCPATAQRGCFFCRTGKEEDVVRHFRMTFPSDIAIAPTRTRYRRTRDDAIEERVPLLPGYVFFEIRREGDPAPHVSEATLLALLKFSRADSVLRLLKYSDDQWQLRGYDDQFAEMLIRTGGNIGVSQAYFDEGKRIRILDGFLKGYEGSIIRLNKKNRTAEVSVDFRGKKMSMWLGYELVAAAETGDET